MSFVMHYRCDNDDCQGECTGTAYAATTSYPPKPPPPPREEPLLDEALWDAAAHAGFEATDWQRVFLNRWVTEDIHRRYGSFVTGRLMPAGRTSDPDGTVVHVITTARPAR